MTGRWYHYALGGLLGLAMLGGLVYRFGLDRVDEEVEVEASGEARRNPFLALERFYSRYADDTRTEWSRAKPGEVATLVFARGVPHATPSRMQTWLDWVGSGGHLVAVAPIVDRDEPERLSPDERFVRAFGFRPRISSERALETPRWRIYSVPESGLPTSRSPITWTSDELDWMAESTSGPALAISRPFGEGRVTLLKSSRLFRNRHVGDGEYATLARDLLALGGQRASEQVTIVRFLRQKSWLAYLWRHTWPAAIVLVLIVGLALWQGRYRFGPIRTSGAKRSRRSRLEHVRASGRFLWRHGGEERLLDATRAALFERIESHHPGFVDASTERQRHLLVDAWGLSELEARQLLESPETIDADIFHHLVEQMESHRRTT